MAIPVDTVWEVQTTGNDANGAGWSNAQKGATGTDMSQGAPTVFTSTLSAVGTTSLTDSAAGFVNTMLGNVIQIAGQGFYCIQGFTSASVVVVDRALGTFSTTSGRVGGPVTLPAILGAAVVGTNTIYIKAGTYTITLATNNVAGGCYSSGVAALIVGYSTNRNTSNTDTKPYFVLSGVSTSVMFACSFSLLYNLSMDGASQTSSRGTTGVSVRCLFANFTNNASTGNAVLCEFTGCTNNAAATGSCFHCVAHGNNNVGFAGIVVTNCIANGNTGHGFQGNSQAHNCVSYGNTGGTTDGFVSGATTPCTYINCISESNGRYGFNKGTAGAPQFYLINCSAKNNSTET